MGACDSTSKVVLRACTFVLFACITGHVYSEAGYNDDRLLLIAKDEERLVSSKHIHIAEQKLFITPGSIAKYLVIPAFRSPEMAVAVYKGTSRESGGLPSKYWVTTTKASRRIMDSASGIPATVPDQGVLPVRRSDAPIADSTATVIHQLWMAMLSDARPRHPLEMGIDSDVIAFYAMNESGHELRAVPFGTGPRCAGMVNLGDQLLKYAAAPARERFQRAKRIEQDALKLLQSLRHKQR